MNEPSKNIVNLFIIGAPKAGTTSLYHYLNQHPDIQMSRVKEPHLFSTDFPDYSNINTLKEYHRLFDWEEGVEYYGEASVWYLYSQEAIDNILSYNPAAKFIVMLRDPVEMLPSLHNQLKLTLMENIEEFEEAWEAVPDRKEGQRIPNTCREPKMLYYDELAMFGKQLEQLLSKIDASNLHIIQFLEFKSDSKHVVRKTLKFLGLSTSVNEINFEVKNERSEIRSPLLNRVVFELSRNLSSVVKRTKKVFGIERLGLLDKVKEQNKRKAQRNTISSDVKKKIEERLREDQKMLETTVMNK